MVKLTGPMSSFGASGTLADLLTYSNSRGTPYMKKKGHTGNPRTNKQTTFRIMFAWLASQWSQIGPANRLTWHPQARLKKISPYNAYIAANTSRWLNYLAPSQTPNADGVLEASHRNVATANWDGNKFNIITNATHLHDGWGFIIHAGTFGGFTRARSTAIIIGDEGDGTPQTFTWLPADPISVRFAFSTFSTDGTLTDSVAGWNVNVP